MIEEKTIKQTDEENNKKRRDCNKEMKAVEKKYGVELMRQWMIRASQKREIKNSIAGLNKRLKSLDN
ncbi:hypothetical protein LCGC14_0896870 [marine sediment metagenome]|uniref:Uncharacterized protein n=1 Tax=marine sediment metagenome TaxID=412755 RepID=A0A0F9PIC8_9ZZZZ